MSLSRPLTQITSRRRLLGGGAAGAVGLAARSSRQMAVAARAFLNSLDESQLGTAWYPDLGDQARTKWSNFPAGASPRAGLGLGVLGDAQRVLVHDLLRASTSSQGYHKLTGAIRADEILGSLQGDQLFSAGQYFASVYGTPEDADWAWMLTGHHMAAAFTVAGERTAFTPMFTGAQPLQIPSGLEAGWQALPQDASRGIELYSALSADQQGAATIGTSSPTTCSRGPAARTASAATRGFPPARWTPRSSACSGCWCRSSCRTPTSTPPRPSLHSFSRAGARPISPGSARRRIRRRGSTTGCTARVS